MIERALVNSGNAGDIVADLFGGSRSTLIACERRKSNARLMEIDPKYADCIVRRSEEYTGKQANLEGDGRTFDVIKTERAGAALCIDRCLNEIATLGAAILTGHPDVEGLCLALSDWLAELRIVQDEKSRQEETRRRDKLEVGEAQDLTA